MKQLCLWLTVALLMPASIWAQYEYEPSEAFPFGRPNPEAPAQISDYAEMIGTCECDSEARNPDGSWQKPEKMLWTFKYIMNGTGVQDMTLKPDGAHSGSIRQFIADSARWYVHYYSNKGPTTVLSAWEGNKKDGEIILYREQKAPNGMDGFYNIRFYEMSDTGYKWLGAWVSKDESIVYPTWKIACTR